MMNFHYLESSVDFHLDIMNVSLGQVTWQMVFSDLDLKFKVTR